MYCPQSSQIEYISGDCTLIDLSINTINTVVEYITHLTIMVIDPTMNTIDLPMIDLSNIILASIVELSDPNTGEIIASMIELELQIEL